jgi:hypothetical protein
MALETFGAGGGVDSKVINKSFRFVAGGGPKD